MTQSRDPAALAAARAAVAELAERLDDLDEATRRRIPRRSVALVLHDLGLVMVTRLEDGRFGEISEYDSGDEPPTDARLTMTSERLFELVDGDLGFAAAWATGKVRVSARLGVLLEIRRFL